MEAAAHGLLASQTETVASQTAEETAEFISGIKDPVVFIGFLEGLVDKVHSLMESSRPEHASRIGEVLERLHRNVVFGNSALIEAKVSQDAARELEKLKNFNDSEKPYVIYTTPTETSTEWSKGCGGTSKSRRYRVLVPVFFMLELFRKSSWQLDERGFVNAALQDMNMPHVSLQLVKKSGLEPLNLTKVCGTKLLVKHFELNLDFTREMNVILLNKPRTAGIESRNRPAFVSAYLHQWWAAIWEEKGRQVAYARGNWPRPEWIPWRVTDIWSMPMIVWLSRE